MTRRELLQNLSGGFGFLAFAGLCAERAQAEAGNPMAPKPPHFPAKAKRIIFLFMEGGPSQYETFEDNRELAAAASSGQSLGSQWKFSKCGQAGIPVCELFPNIGKHVDDLCILNGLNTDSPAHAQATFAMHTGAVNFVRPSMGAWVVYGLGTENQNLPGYITINPTTVGGAQNYGSVFLPAYNQGTPYRTRSGSLPNIANKEMDRSTQRQQLDLLQSLNRSFLKKAEVNPELDGVIQTFEMAFRMQTAAPEVLNIEGESAAVKKMYGLEDTVTHDFGVQCLMARRLAEAGVRFIEVSHGTWDHHGTIRPRIQTAAREVDQPIAALLEDLKQRGLLDDTLVLWGGEFGRTAAAQFGDGRNHNNRGFTMWLAGGGVKRGFRYGGTDAVTGAAVSGKLHVHDLHATILNQLGLDHTRLTYRYSGRDMRLTDVYGTVVKEILA